MNNNIFDNSRPMTAGEPELLPHHPLVAMSLIAVLRPYVRNARFHSQAQIRQIMASNTRFGWINPIIVDTAYNIICGHGRYEAAKRLGIQEVPVIQIDHLTEAELKAYRLADNKIAENASWNDELIRIELNDITELDVSFDLEPAVAARNPTNSDRARSVLRVRRGDCPSPRT